jgi:hypothetical protein
MEFQRLYFGGRGFFDRMSIIDAKAWDVRLQERAIT